MTQKRHRCHTEGHSGEIEKNLNVPYVAVGIAQEARK